MKKFFLLAYLALFSMITFADYKTSNILDINIIEEKDGGFRVSMERLPPDYAGDDKKYRSKTKTDLRVVIYNKTGKGVESFYLKWFEDPSIGQGGADQETETAFTRFKRYSSLTYKLKPSAYKVEVFVDKRPISSKLINEIAKIEP